MNPLLSRFALAGFALALAAAVVPRSGAGGLGGSLGSLFGYNQRVKPLADDAAVMAVASASPASPIAPASATALANARHSRATARTRHAPGQHAAPRSRRPSYA